MLFVLRLGCQLKCLQQGKVIVLLNCFDLFILQVHNQVLRIDGVSLGILDKDLVATRLRIAYINVYVFVYLFFVGSIWPCVAWVVKQAEIWTMM